jgi:broad specificity phosphatase PhoE
LQSLVACPGNCDNFGSGAGGRPSGRGDSAARYDRRVRLILVRHGESEATVKRVVGGEQGDTGLSPRGRLQAEALRDRLAASGEIRADRMLSSVLPRAVETAEILAPAVGVDTFEQDCDLCEMHPGDADGVGWPEYERRYGSFDMMAEPDRPFAPRGESLNDFRGRIARVMHGFAERLAGESVVVVCHGGVIVVSITALFDIPRPGLGTQLDPVNTSITEWLHDAASGIWTLGRYNDAVHLDGLS